MSELLLNTENLDRIEDSIQRPNFDRKNLKSGIVHIGVGGFHRSHEAYYVNELLENSNSDEWGICGVGLREADRKIADILNHQDYLYTLISKHPDGVVENKIIGSIVGFLLGIDDPNGVIEKLAHPDTKIVSLTITEGGYNIDASGEFDFTNQDIVHDLETPTHPKTVFGFLAAALKKRRKRELPAFTILSCDNVEHNGDVARYTLLAFARKQDPALAEWIESEVCFPNSMVDRITPVTTQNDIDYLKSLDLVDEWPVTCEPFIQWVIEDKFSNGRPVLEKVGVQFVPDVTPYEKMKLRLLNAGHSVLGILGSIHGHETIDDCVNDPVFSAFLKAFMDIEVTPVLDPVAGVDLLEYKNSLIERFSNPNIKDHVSRICSESSAKLPKFLIPTIHENLAKGGSIEYATLILTAWCYYCDKGLNQHNEPLKIIDTMQQELHEAAKGTSANALSFLHLRSIFNNLADNPSFTNLYSKLISSIYKNPDIRQFMVVKTD
ncbi:MAG: mannitol dehydrogenase family protein [Cyclobacteriaceae bacterium]